MSHLVSREEANLLTREIIAAANDVLRAHGYEPASPRTTYGDRYVLKIESTPVEEGPGGINLNSPEAQSYKLEASYNDLLDPDALGREFTVRGETYTFAGYVPKRPKYPYVGVSKRDGRTFKFTRDIERFLRPLGK